MGLSITSPEIRALELNRLEVLEAAVEILTEELRLPSATAGPADLETLSTENDLGALLSILERFAEAKPRLLRALKGRAKALGAFHPDTVGTYYNLGRALFELGEYEASAPRLARALEGWKKALGPLHPRVSLASISYGKALLSTGRAQEALRSFREAHDAASGSVGDTHSLALAATTGAGESLMKLGKPQLAGIFLRDAFKLSAEHLGPGQFQTVSTAICLSNALTAIGRREQALKVLRSTLKAAQTSRDATYGATQAVILAAGALARALQGAGDTFGTLKACGVKALAMMELPFPAGEDTLRSHMKLAELLLEGVSISQGEAILAKVAERFEQDFGPGSTAAAEALELRAASRRKRRGGAKPVRSWAPMRPPR
jgi:tetratricopeptide (TPR) repeat protein